MNINKIGETLVACETFSGVIHISEGEKTKLHIASGFANRGELIHNNLDTKFGIASGTKGFTAMAIMKLIEQGKLNLEDDVFEILPMEFLNMKEKVTVKHLLTHTSGIYDYFNEEIIEDFAELFEKVPLYAIDGPQDMLPLLTEGECYFKPGEKFKYCNSGFVILGILIEVISGMPYKIFLEKEILIPYGLKDTGCYPMNALPKNTAYGYEQDEAGDWFSNIFSIPKMCTGDGGLMTTSGDMGKLWRSLVGHKMFDEALTSEILKEQANIEDDLAYGLGIYIQYDNDHELMNYYLEGEDPGISFFSAYYVKSDTVVTIISNTSDGTWDLWALIKEFIDA